MDTFKAKISIIGINPFVPLSQNVLKNIFKQALKDKGPIPVRGTVDGHPFIQTLVKYSGKWRLYMNRPMLKAAQKEVGDSIEIEIEFDPVARTIAMHPKLEDALKKNKKSKTVFDGLPPSRQKEIIRYISFLKTEAAVERTITRAVQFLLGNSRFIGSDKP